MTDVPLDDLPVRLRAFDFTVKLVDDPVCPVVMREGRVETVARQRPEMFSP